MSDKPKAPATPVDQEISTMRRLCGLLERLDDAARERVVGYLLQRFPPAAGKERTTP